MKLVSKDQILAFIAPWIAIGSGAVAAWLFVHVHILGIFHINQSVVATDIAGGIVFAVSAGLTWASHHFHWLPLAVTALRRP